MKFSILSHDPVLKEGTYYIGGCISLSLGKWIPIHGKLYHFSQERITFAKAKATCEHNYGKLFEPTTKAINNMIAAIAKETHQMVNPWIGIHHLHDEGRTVFVSNKTTVVWNNWDANEPNNENDEEDCVHLYNERHEHGCLKNMGTGGWASIGSGPCNDVNNREDCDWDGGDCCGNDVDTRFCTFCQCHEPYFELKQCKYEQMSNGICNDETNTEECKWDGGDCCGNDVDMTDCTDCECLEPFRWNDNNCDEFRKFICEKEDTG